MKAAFLAALSFFTASIPFSNALAEGGRIFLVDSYDEGYSWSKDIIEGAKSVIGDKAELKIVRMDTKRNSDEAYKKKAGEKVFAEMQAWKPDVVIACDDNASIYFVVPFLKDKETPCVFCGLNWDASIYGFPCSNVTGMIEVSLVKELADQLKKLSKGSRIGHLGKDNETDRKEGEWIAKKLKSPIDSRYIKSFEEWKREYALMQDCVDILILQNNAGIKGWNDAEARDFVMKNTKIPTGATFEFMSNFALVTFAKDAREQGEWSAATALRLLNGERPSSIPVAENKRAVISLNLELANSVGMKFPIDLLKAAKVRPRSQPHP